MIDEIDEEDDKDLSSFLEEDEVDNKKLKKKSVDLKKGLSKKTTSKPKPICAYKQEKRKARVDITKSSKEDHRARQRYTKKELDDYIEKEYKYMKSKPYMVIHQFTIMEKYPFKKKKSDSDIITEDNTDYDYALVFGKQLKWKSQLDFKHNAHLLGEIMFMRRGVYWIEGEEIEMEPHFALVVNKKRKRIKPKRIRDLFSTLKQRLRSGKPFGIYSEFPIILKRT